MWTPTTRQQHSRSTSRYQTDLTDKEWRLVEPHLPAARKTGRPCAWLMREIINAIFYVLRGIAWRLLPSDFPPWPTVYRWFAAFRDGSVFEKINHALVMADRERVGRGASPSAAIINSQSVKTTQAGGQRGYDAGKKIKGRKRRSGCCDEQKHPRLAERDLAVILADEAGALRDQHHLDNARVFEIAGDGRTECRA